MRKFQIGDEVFTASKRRPIIGRRRAVIIGYASTGERRSGSDEFEAGGYRIRYLEGDGPATQSGFYWLARELEPADSFEHWVRHARKGQTRGYASNRSK